MGTARDRAQRRAFVLNLDADLELGAGPGYRPSRRVLAAMTANETPLRALLDEGDVIIGDETEVGSLRGFVGHAFCPTPRAVALMRRAGAEPARHPSVEVLRTVASRAFGFSAERGLPGALFANRFELVIETLAKAPPIGRAWRLKRAYGMAGRGHRTIAPGEPSTADAAWIRASMPQGLVVEPEVRIVSELGLHGWLEEDGALGAGAVVRQRCDARGAWIASERHLSVHAGRLGEELVVVGRELHRAGFFGPFGIDSHEYEVEGGQAFQPRSEINPRYSMGWAVGYLGR